MSTKPGERLYLSPPHMGERERDLLMSAFDSNWIAPLGPMVDAFEKAVIDWIGSGHALALSSGTGAIHLALHLVGVVPGDRVVVSDLTFIGSVVSAVHMGARPIFIDADEKTWNMDPDLLAEALEGAKRRGQLPKAVLPTDLYGQCVDLDRIREVCEPYDIPVIVDSAEAMGSLYKGSPGRPGAKAAVFSFNGNKIITTSGGGMLVSDDSDLIALARNLSQQARDPVPHYQHSRIGWNYRMSNLLAAVGIGQFGVLEERIQRRRAIFDGYHERLADLPGISFMPEAPYCRANRWLTVVQIDSALFGAKPAEIINALTRENIEARPVWQPMHMQPVFENGGYSAETIGGEVGERLFSRGVCLPSGSAMDDGDLDRVCDVIRLVAGN